MIANKTRRATPTEFDQIYRMGSDVWCEGSEDAYLASCRDSTKYAHGIWYVLESYDGELLSSLIVYDFEEGRYGIGSIATPTSFRKQGHASQLLAEVVRLIEEESPGATLFLYSDIDPSFYEKFEFTRVPAW
jgi:ribosomal protein S18 acetylase RimI-like enzyme